MISFNVPAVLGNEKEYLSDLFEKKKFSGDGFYTKKSQEALAQYLGAPKALLTTSCTDALEMSAILLDIKEGDEVIMPSFTFVSTSNAFVLRGAKIVFIDVNKNTMNIDENLIESAITPKTKAIVVVHYAGWSCDLDKVMSLSKKHSIPVIEDAAQALGATYKGKKLGTFGVMSCFSFHDTKNIQCGEGGALVINDEAYFKRAEIIREKGTNRSQFLRGQTDKYTWVDLGSSFLPSELNAAFLFAQLGKIDFINADRVRVWNRYHKELKDQFEVLECPSYCTNNAHLFSIRLKDIEQRTRFISYLKEHNISAVFHYVPLHSSPAGKSFSRFHGDDRFTTAESERLVRLPIYFGMTEEDQNKVIKVIKDFASVS